MGVYVTLRKKVTKKAEMGCDRARDLNLTVFSLVIFHILQQIF